MNWWNGLPGWGKAAIIITVIAVVVVATVGIAAPELLPAIPFLLAGDFSVLGGGGAFCEDDPAACVQPTGAGSGIGDEFPLPVQPPHRLQSLPQPSSLG